MYAHLHPGHFVVFLALYIRMYEMHTLLASREPTLYVNAHPKIKRGYKLTRDIFGLLFLFLLSLMAIACLCSDSEIELLLRMCRQ